MLSRLRRWWYAKKHGTFPPDVSDPIHAEARQSLKLKAQKAYRERKRG